MKSSTVIALSVVVVLALLAGSEGMSLRSRRDVESLGAELYCRCIQTESRRIIKHIAKVELFPANSHCDVTEIIATMKVTGQEVCLDPEAPWVKKVIEKMISSKTL